MKGNLTAGRDMVDIGSNACLDSGTLMIFCNIIPSGVSVTREWFLNGVLQSNTDPKLTVSTVSNAERNYTCAITNQCSRDSATTIVRRK